MLVDVVENGHENAGVDGYYGRQNRYRSGA